MKYLIINEANKLEKIVSYLNEKLGLPQIHRRLNLYSVSEDIQVEILDNKIYFIDKTKKKFNLIKNKNLKSFFKYIQSNKDYGFYINDVVLLQYKGLDLLFDTYHGNLIKLSDNKLVSRLCKKFALEKYDNINDHKPLITSQPEPLFDEIGNLNSKIKNYANKTGLDIRSSSASLRVRLSNVSNDYSYLEKYYKLIMNNDLLSTNFVPKYETNFKGISIIIPTYNQNVIPTLLSIQGQHVSRTTKSKIQVIVIDDGSKRNVYKQIKTIKDKLDYELDVITLNHNSGLSNARNVGLSIAKHELLLFIDSDIILSKDYISDINLRLQIIPNAIVVAMRKNIDKDSKIVSEERLLAGVERTLEFDDSRVVTKSKKYHIGWDKAFNGETISILDDTNYFKELSFGSKIGIYDLPSVVTGHNIGVNKKMLKKNPAFCTLFKGWGLEDAYFAAELISNGNYVIPMVSSCVYHQNHPPRSGCLKKKTEEAARNYELYHSLLDGTWEET